MPSNQTTKSRAIPLYVRILIGVALGTLFGMFLPAPSATVSEFGRLVLVLLKALATPLILFAVLDAFIRTHIPAVKGLKLIGISLLNACVAISIGLSLSNLTHAGASAHTLAQAIHSQSIAKPKLGATAAKPAVEKQPTLDLVENVKGWVPESIVTPFAQNSVISVVLLAVIGGAAIRKVKESSDASLQQGVGLLESLIGTIFQILQTILHWLIQLIPFAVFAVVAGVVAKTGPKVFTDLGTFLLVMITGLVIHAVLYYSMLIFVLARKSPIWFFRNGIDAIITALSAGSSLATLPITLRCLDEKLKVSTDSSRLAACVGTNLNHDGIILYEASAALFVSQAMGFHLTLGQQMTIALSSVMAGIGIAGVPEAGLITLPLVLKAAGLPDAVAVAVFAVILPVDWIVGRFRAATNVISDMVVAVILDQVHPTITTDTEHKATTQTA